MTDRWVCWRVSLEAWHVKERASPSLKLIEVAESRSDTLRESSITETKHHR